MKDQRIYADLNKWEEVDGQFRVILTARGTHQDLEKHSIVLEEGLELKFWVDDEDADGNPDPLYFQGAVHYSEDARNWFAAVIRQDIRNASEIGNSKPLKSIGIDSFVEYKEVSTNPSTKAKATPKFPIKL